MTITLATTWEPRGELERFVGLLPQLEAAYTSIVVICPPHADISLVDEINRLPIVAAKRLQLNITQEWPCGRQLALQYGLAAGASHIHYIDMDRLLRWIEIYSAEWKDTLQILQDSDVLIMGRTSSAYDTHPQALVQTEVLSNKVISFFLGQVVDASAGSKSFSRRAAEFLVANADGDHPFGVDAEWPILLHRAGFKVDYLAVNGLDWESADRYRKSAASITQQQQAAVAYDAIPANWAHRIAVAQEIIQIALDVAQRPITKRDLI